MLDAVYFHENLIKAPLPLRVLAQIRRALPPYRLGEDWAEAVNLETNTFVADVHAPSVNRSP